VAKKSQKEVAKHPHMGSREESFGSAPGELSIAGGGTMHIFGYKLHTGEVWPDAPTSVDQKTGFPRDFQTRTKSIHPKGSTK
jgi:hypothetical protein